MDINPVMGLFSTESGLTLVPLDHEEYTSHTEKYGEPRIKGTQAEIVNKILMED